VTVDIAYPSDRQILDLARELRLPPAAIVRDIVRMVEVLHLVERGFLNDDCVLTGGMALRCYKSSRVTMRDADTSSRYAVSDEELVAALEYEDDHVSIRPSAPASWPPRYKLRTVHPVDYDPAFTGIALTDVRDRQFSLTVNMRGLDCPAVWKPLLHHYPWVLWEGEGEVPCMEIGEILAEKVCGYCIHADPRHYSDLAFVGGTQWGRLKPRTEEIRRLVATKLDRNLRYQRNQCQKANIAAYDDLRLPLESPERLGVDANWGDVRYAATGVTAFDFADARYVVAKRVIPLLWDR
jgi:Nucleotidyl transferase AbiEii toxin, Type IV TA system